MVAGKESGIDCNSEPTLEGSAPEIRRIVRDVSTSLDMTEGIEGAAILWHCSFSAVFVIPSEVEDLTIPENPHDNNFRRDGKDGGDCCRPSFLVHSGVASSEASRMGHLKLLAERKLELDMTERSAG